MVLAARRLVPVVGRRCLGVGGGGLQEVGHILIVDLDTGYTGVFIL